MARLIAKSKALFRNVKLQCTHKFKAASTDIKYYKPTQVLHLKRLIKFLCIFRQKPAILTQKEFPVSMTLPRYKNTVGSFHFSTALAWLAQLDYSSTSLSQSKFFKRKQKFNRAILRLENLIS